MPTDSDDIYVRLAELEVGHEYMKKSMDDNTITLRKVGDVVDKIESRLDKQNGAIPHMNAAISQLTSDFASFQKYYMEKELAAGERREVKAIQDFRDDAESKFKIKLIWGALVLVIGAAVTALAKFLLGV